jgi:ferric hydroxamate transport system ATP-binding protein
MSMESGAAPHGSDVVEADGDALARDVVFDVRGAGFEVPGRTVLHPVSLSVKRGKMVALIGHNGSGKSSLIKLMARQLTTSHGDILLYNRALSAWGARDFAREIAYLPQYPPAGTGMTVAELVSMSRYPWHGALGRFGQRDRHMVDQAMDLTDVRRFARAMADTLSGGERQRVWIAALIAQEASCLLLDEPTSALDIAHQISVLQLLRELVERKGLTVVVVLHDVNLAARFCDEMVALRAGAVLASGTPAELMRAEALESIYGLPMGILRHPETGAPISFAR